MRGVTEQDGRQGESSLSRQSTTTAQFPPKSIIMLVFPKTYQDLYHRPILSNYIIHGTCSTVKTGSAMMTLGSWSALYLEPAEKAQHTLLLLLLLSSRRHCTLRNGQQQRTEHETSLSSFRRVSQQGSRGCCGQHADTHRGAMSRTSTGRELR